MADMPKTPNTTKAGASLSKASPKAEIESFLDAAKAVAATAPQPGAGRLVFAMDATMSRQPTWDMACTLQGQMFEACAALGGLGVQLVYFRGFNECRASGWVGDPRRLTELMSKIDCRGGHTQIGRVLAHVRDEAARQPVRAFVLVGDAMEEHADDLCALAGQLSLVGVKGFMFQEGHDVAATSVFREIARLTGGAYARFDTGSAAQLLDLLKAAASYAAGGRGALARLAERENGARGLLTQMGNGR
ncbi:MAG: VWA domain-containing protein [Bosea sp. (in: a-proteobacteria)]